jgi:hypothetical protein
MTLEAGFTFTGFWLEVGSIIKLSMPQILEEK